MRCRSEHLLGRQIRVRHRTAQTSARIGSAFIVLYLHIDEFFRGAQHRGGDTSATANGFDPRSRHCVRNVAKVPRHHKVHSGPAGVLERRPSCPRGGGAPRWQRTGRRGSALRPRGSCRPSSAIAFEHRLTHRAQGEACVPLQPVQMPFEARDRGQVHRGPRVPVQRRREASESHPASRSAPSNRGVAASRGGRCPPQGLAHGTGVAPRVGSSQRGRSPSRRGPTALRPSAPAP